MQSIETMSQKSVSRRRSSLEILCEILQELSNPNYPFMRRWRISSKCTLTYASSKMFLDRLEAKGMVEIVSAKGFTERAYRLTEDGFSFLQTYQLMMSKLFDES